MRETIKYTHYGWFGFCPVYIADIDTDEPDLAPRWENAVGDWLFTASEAMFFAMFKVNYYLNPEMDPAFPIRVSGELDEPFERTYETE
jgi:hypothetical protein